MGLEFGSDGPRGRKHGSCISGKVKKKKSETPDYDEIFIFGYLY